MPRIRFLFLVTLIATMVTAPSWAEVSPVGRWIAYDEKTGNPSSIIEITAAGTGLAGKIVKIFPKPGDPASPVCKKCDGPDKGQPMVGLTILKGFHHDGDTWSDGTILDPRSGEVYSSELKVDSSGKKLLVRGYVGISLLGKTVTWTRIDTQE